MEGKMENHKLKSVPPESMNVNDYIDWVRTQAQVSHDVCNEANDYFNQLGRHYKNITLLMEEITKAKESQDYDLDEVKQIAHTVSEVVDAIISLRERIGLTSAETLTIDQVEEEFLSAENGQQAKNQYDAQAKAFLKKYNYHKARLGFKTQKEVSEFTKIDHRYISILEQGKHKPQFKTLKKLAEAFGIKVADLQ